MPKKYYIVTNLTTNEETLVNTLEDLEILTGIDASAFKGMKPAELWIIDDYQIICDQTRPVCNYYYKNLWR